MVPAYLPFRLGNYYPARRGWLPPSPPINLTFSVTNKCQAHCRTCHIWKLYLDNPEMENKELSLAEIEKTFKSMSPVFFFNISGGCPFLRDDLPEIVELACVSLKPRVIHIPTNGLDPDRILTGITTILKNLASHRENRYLQIKPSIDEIGLRHDHIRGTDGGFDHLLYLFDQLKGLKKAYGNLQVSLGTVISSLNIYRLHEIIPFIDRLEPDTYIGEIAEIREEMINQGSAITPDPDQYELAVDLLRHQIVRNLRRLRGLGRITAAFRWVYYPLSLRILRENRQVIPCYAGFSNVHLSPYGEVWPCATLASSKSLGNVRNYGYDFKKIWHSRRAAEVRNYIRAGRCSCPLANQAYANMLLHPGSLFQAIKFSLLPGFWNQKP